MKAKTKHCPDCGKTKAASEFNKARGAKDGLQTYCRPCHGKRNKKYHAAKTKTTKRTNHRRGSRVTLREAMQIVSKIRALVEPINRDQAKEILREVL